ncbi:MAG: hypothetical protein ABI879_01500 [Actinomycetota bacterium]
MSSIGRTTGLACALTLVTALIAAPAAAVNGSAGSAPTVRRDVRATLHGQGSRTGYPGYASSRSGPFTSGSRGTAAADASASSAPVSRTPSSLLSFDAIPQIEGFEPSDTSGALGDHWFFTTVNTRFALWTPTGTQQIAPTLLDSLAPDTDGFDVFDPKVVYDPYNDTFVMVYLATRDAPHGSLIVITAIPDATADQQSTWCTNVIRGDQVATDAAQWADYPSLGFSADRVTVSTNQFKFPTSRDAFSYAQVLSFPKTSLYDCSQTLTVDVFAGSATQNPDGSPAMTIQPAQTAGAATSDQFMLSFSGPGRSSALTAWRIRPTAAGLVLKKGEMLTGRTHPAPAGTQGGGSLTNNDTWWDTGDLRLINAFYDADRNALYAAHVVGRDLGPDTVTGGYPESVIRWYEVLPASRLVDSVLNRKGIVGQAETDAGWPSVATDASGNLFITYSRASEPLNEFLSAWAAEIVPGSTTATTVLLRAGTAVHDALKGVERWGDFTGINRDPVDPALIAMVNQIATLGSAWQQTVNVVTHG